MQSSDLRSRSRFSAPNLQPFFYWKPRAVLGWCSKALPRMVIHGYNKGLSRRSIFVLMIRLSRIGKKKKPYCRVVVIEKTRPRNGRVVELVGTYDPLKKPAELKLDAERIKHWLGVGAQPSDTVRSFIKLQKIA